MTTIVRALIAVLILGAALYVYRSATSQSLSGMGARNAVEALKGGPANRGTIGVRPPDPNVRPRP